MSEILQLLSEDMAELVAGMRRRLVQIQNGRGAGAGSVWHSDGLIITNAHVADRKSINVQLPDGRTVTGRVLAFDPRLDLAALSVEEKGLPSVAIGDSRQLRPGELLVAMGHPWGVHGAVNVGSVIGVGSQPGEGPMAGRDMIAGNLRLRPGHSGGPMMDANGRLVGINTMITGPEVAMAVPVHVAKEFLQNALHSKGGQVHPGQFGTPWHVIKGRSERRSLAKQE